MLKPAFVPPMLATLVGAPFDGDEWLFEIKWDGFRVEAVVDGQRVRLWTRGEQDAARFFGDFLAPSTWIGPATGLTLAKSSFAISPTFDWAVIWPPEESTG